MTKLVIIGGSDAGLSAALRSKEVDVTTDVTVIVADGFPNYSICGLPFYLSGEVADWHSLAHRSIGEITRAGIQLLLYTTARQIIPTLRTVSLIGPQGNEYRLPYDRLIIATGAVPARPPVSGLDLSGVYLLRSMADSFAIEEHLNTHSPHSAVIIGGGYIGLEMADALTHRGVKVTVVEHHASMLKTVDSSFGRIVQAELEYHGVNVVNGVAIEQISYVGGQLCVAGSAEFSLATDLIIVGVGVQPLTDLAQAAGIAVGEQGAIRTTRAMETNKPDIYAAGDCVETYHHLLHRPTYLPLGSTAHKQGRIAGENAVGGHREYAGTLGTQVVKVFDVVVARTGLRDEEAVQAGFSPLTVEFTTWDHKAYYPGAHSISMRVTGDSRTGQLLGAQIVGHWHGEVAKRIDTFSTALFHEMTVDDLNQLDLSYTPPVSSPWDAIQMSAQTWVARASH